MEFEWDEANIAKHGIDFVFAQALFDGRFVITAQSPRGGEDRYATTGRIDGRFITAVWTWRDGAGGSFRQGEPGVKKSKGTARYSARQIDAMRKEGRDRTDFRRVDAMTPAEVEALAGADDVDNFDWANAKVGFPGPKQQLTVRLDKDVIDWFRSQGSGYQTRMNAVLRSFVEAQRERTG